jgi:hypothetical protein
MHAVKDAEGAHRIALRRINEPAMKEERFQRELNDCEHEPYKRHQVDPPK